MVSNQNSDEQQTNEFFYEKNTDDLRKLLDELEEKDQELFQKIREEGERICSASEKYLNSGL
jgi:acetate kinase